MEFHEPCFLSVGLGGVYAAPPWGSISLSVSATGVTLSISSIRTVWPDPIPAETTTVPLPVIISKKLRASDMEIILVTGISFVCNHKNLYICITRRSVIV